MPPIEGVEQKARHRSADASARRPLPPNVKLLGWASLLNDIASEMMYPLLPEFLKLLAAVPFVLGVMEGVAESVSSLLKLWFGGRSDQAGRRRQFVVFGYGLAALLRPIIGLATAWWQVVLLRTGDRVGKGVRTSPRDALIADSAPPQMHGRAFGFHQAMDHLGAATGPVLAALFLITWPNQIRTLFLLTLIPGLIVTGLLVLRLRDVPSHQPPRQKMRLTMRPFGPKFRLFLVALIVFTLGNSSDLFLLQRMGDFITVVWGLPILWCGFHILKAIGNWLAGPVVDRIGPRPMILLGWLVYAGIYLGFALAGIAWQTVALFLAYALFYALTEPAEKALVVQLGGVEQKGLAYGWYNCAVGIAVLPANLLFGALYTKISPATAFATGAGLALAAAGLMLGVRQRGAACGPGEVVV